MAGPKAGAVDVTPRSRGDDPRVARYKLYRNPDRTFSAVISTGAVHYQAVPGGAWLDKVPRFSAGGTRTNEQRSDASDVAMRTYQVGTGGNRRWWVEFVETLSQKGIRFELSFQPTPVTGTNELRFADSQARTWSYFHTRVGGKMLGPPIPSAEGPKTFPMRYELIGAADPLVPQADGSISSGTVFSMPNPVLLGADRFAYEAASWGLVADTLTLSWDDSSLPPSAFPYRVDPQQTFAVAGGTDDQRAFKVGASYPPTAAALQRDATGTELSLHRSFATPSYHVHVGLLEFDTSALGASASVVDGALQLRVNDKGNADSLSMVAGWESWTGSSAADWTNTPSATAHAGAAIASITTLAVNDFALSNLSNVNLVGNSQVRLHISQRASDAAPTVQNYVVFATFEDPTNQEPRIVLDYHLGEPLAPEALLSQSGLSGAVSAIQDDPDTPDANWLTAQDPAAFANQYAGAQDGSTPGGFAGQLTSPDNAVGSAETTQATSTGATQNSDYGTYFSFGSAFAGIPDDATITGVTLEARQWIGTTVRGTVGWRLDSAAGTQIANEISGTLSITAAPAAGTAGTGNSYSSWSALPTVAQLKSAAFRARVRFRRTASQATTYTLDWVRLTVTYSQDTEARASFPRPSTGNLALGAGLQEFYALVRKKGTGSNPSASIELWENGALVSTVASATAVSSTTGVTLSGLWDTSVLADRGGSEVEARIVGSGASGGVLEVGAVRWWAGSSPAPTSPLVPAYAPIAPY